MLTNYHVIAGCSRVTLKGGTPVSVIAGDSRRDLALLLSQTRFSEIVHLRRDQTIELGEPVTVFGYPFYAEISTSLNLTNGVVTADRGVGDDPMRFQLNAAVQPGNSGGPVLDEAGLLIGVVVARLNDWRAVARSGAIPQTMNYAIRGQIVESFLLESGILIDKTSPTGKADLRAIAREMQSAVVPIICFK